jgi:hypothetical protein
MTRLTSLALISTFAGLAGGVAHAQSQAEIAEKLNDEGKALAYNSQYAEAAKKFQSAVARVPEAKYFMNLCYARLQLGELGDALTACKAVAGNSPSDDVRAAADKLIAKINETANEQHLKLTPTGGGGSDPGVDPNQPPDPNRPPDPNYRTQPQPVRYAPVVARPPSQNLALAITPDNKYTWTLGIDLFGGGGQVGQKDWYGNTATGFRLKSDYLIDPASRVGAQGYLQVNHLNKGANQSSSFAVDSLDIVDLGVAAYKHICLGATPRLCITPLVGGHVALMSPSNDMDGTGSQVFNYAALGGRGEIAAAYAFGYRFEHVIQVVVGANVYSRVLSGPSDNVASLGTASEVGLDKGGAVGYLGLGYTYRFNTPIGSSPFITLQ